MKKFALGSLGILMVMLFAAGCQKAGSQLPSDETLPEDRSLFVHEAPLERLTSEQGVTIRTEKNEYNLPVDDITIVLTNSGTEEYSTGMDVFLEKKVKEKWFRVPMKKEFFTEEAMVHFPGDSTSMEVDLEGLDYELIPGDYRAALNGLGAPFSIIDN